VTRRKMGELILAGILVALGIFVISVVRTYQDPMAAQYPTLRSTFIPTLWASILVILGVLYLGSTLFQILSDKKKTTEEKGKQLSAAEWKIILRRIVVTLIALLIYTRALGLLPFWLVISIFLFSMFYNFGQTKLKFILPLSLGMGIAMHYLFVTLMYIPL